MSKIKKLFRGKQIEPKSQNENFSVPNDYQLELLIGIINRLNVKIDMNIKPDFSFLNNLFGQLPMNNEAYKETLKFIENFNMYKELGHDFALKELSGMYMPDYDDCTFGVVLCEFMLKIDSCLNKLFTKNIDNIIDALSNITFKNL